jgi:hypothetical protein
MKATLQDEIELVQEELSKITDLDDEIRRVEDLRQTLLSIENPLSGYYALTEFPDVVVALRNGLYYGSKETAARGRQEFYRQTGMRVKVGEELEISFGVDGISVSNDDGSYQDASSRHAQVLTSGVRKPERADGLPYTKAEMPVTSRPTMSD